MRADDQLVAMRAALVVAIAGAMLALWAGFSGTTRISVADHPPSGEAWVAASEVVAQLDEPVIHMEKLDRSLIEEINARIGAAKDEGASSEALQQATFDVVLELAQSPAPPKGLPRDQAYREMERQLEQAQAAVVATLRRMGVTTFDRLVFSGGLAATLTLDQIHQISGEPDVRLIRLRQIRKVTTASEGVGVGAVKS